MRRQPVVRVAAVLAIYLLIAVVYTHPLLTQGASAIANDPGDPILNTSILWWNAITLPFSPIWWSPPYFYPSKDISAFTENLVGISPLASPVYWTTGNPLLAYNVSLYLTWPLSAFAAYLVALVLTKRHDGAFLAGLAYGFSPYRMAELGHLQSLSTYWIAFALFGLHAYLISRRIRWLVVFALGWLLQSLANMYLLMYGAVFVGLWLAYFCTTRDRFRDGLAIAAAWFAGSLPLIPIVWKYRSVHEYYGLRRDMAELSAYSTPIQAWLDTPDLVRFWHPILSSGTDNLFPGLTAVVLVSACAIALARQSSTTTHAYRRIRIALLAAMLLSLVAIALTMKWGPWETLIAGVTIKMSNLNRALGILMLSGGALVAISPRARQALARRDPLVFYIAATIVMAILSCGTVIRTGDQIVFEQGPYRWLLMIPGFSGLRVVTRFWMIGILTLSVAAGLAFAKLRLSAGWRPAVAAVAALGLMVDGWVSAPPMAEAPTLLPEVEPATESRPILELPIGPGFDAAPTFRSIGSGRLMVNGVSGYDPAHYDPLRAGLNSRDPETLRALASYGSIDVVIDTRFDPDGSWRRYVSDVAGGDPILKDDRRVTYRIPQTRVEEPVLGESVPIVAIEAFRHDPSVIIDGRMETEWGDNPQRRGQWVIVDLGSPQVIGGLSHGLGEYARDFPRRLVVEVSLDKEQWDRVWQGNTNALAFRAAVASPRYAVMRFAFEPRSARYVRLRQTADHPNMWRIAELQVHAPAGR